VTEDEGTTTGAVRLWLPVIVAIGAVVRLMPGIGADFPVGDGGLFATMIRDIRDAGFALPAFTSYNGGDIPFAYPPLALYFAAALPLDPLVTLQWLPPIVATASIVLVYVIGTSLGSARIGLAAAAFYALAPFGFFWLVQGGGLTRALAMLLALGAIAAALRGRAAFVGVLGGLTALTHPETAIFAAVTVASILAIQRAWRAFAIAGAVSLAIVMPWVIAVTSHHGIDPFVAAGGARSVNPLAAVLSISGDRPGALDLAAAVGLIALAASGVRWLYVASIATAVLASTSVATHLAPFMAVGVGVVAATRPVPRGVLVATSVLLLVGAGVSIGNPEPLGPDDSALMAWIRDETPEDARFVVLSDEIWSRADEAEWFPYLADRVSVMTMQGREWLPDWQALDESRRELLHCTDRDCVVKWTARHSVDYVFLADGCCARLAAALDGDRVQEVGSASLFRLRR